MAHSVAGRRNRSSNRTGRERRDSILTNTRRNLLLRRPVRTRGCFWDARLQRDATTHLPGPTSHASRDWHHHHTYSGAGAATGWGGASELSALRWTTRTSRA